MDQDLAKGPIGDIGNYDVAFKAGFLVMSANVNIPPGEALSASLTVDSDKVIDAIAAAIPGKFDDAVFALLKALLKK